MPKKRTVGPEEAKSITIYAPDSAGNDYLLKEVKPGDPYAEGLTEEWILILKQMDLEIDTCNERESAHQDDSFEARQIAFNADPDHNENPLAMLATTDTSPEHILFGSDTRNANEQIVDAVYEIVEKELPLHQEGTMRDLYGQCDTLQSIADRNQVSRQAIFNRDVKLKNTVKKKLAERGISADNIDTHGIFHF